MVELRGTKSVALRGRIVVFAEERIETHVVKSDAPMSASMMLLSCWAGGDDGGVGVVGPTIVRKRRRRGIMWSWWWFCMVLSFFLGFHFLGGGWFLTT